MKETKLKVWNKATKKMYEVIRIDFYDEKVGYLFADPITQGEAIGYFKFSDIELMQSTGLKDKNGKEIYEGDILKIQTSDFYSKKIIDKYIAQVCFSRGGFFVLTDGHHTDFCLWGKSTGTMEVIGNIYENADLLEVETSKAV